MKRFAHSLSAALLMGASLLHAGTCYDADSLKVGWKAFKTPAKAGVGGTFDSAVLTLKHEKANSVAALLEGASVSIKTSSVNSGNPGRDKTLVAQFFKMLSDEKIEAHVSSVAEKKLIVAITMNGKTLQVPMNYSVLEDVVEAHGVIDLFDFAASKALSSINTACYELHDGKTWNDVEIRFEMPLSHCEAH